MRPPSQLTLDGREEPLPVLEYVPPPPRVPPPRADVVPLWLARQRLRGVKPTRTSNYPERE